MRKIEKVFNATFFCLKGNEIGCACKNYKGSLPGETRRSALAARGAFASPLARRHQVMSNSALKVPLPVLIVVTLTEGHACLDKRAGQLECGAMMTAFKHFIPVSNVSVDPELVSRSAIQHYIGSVLPASTK